MSFLKGLERAIVLSCTILEKDIANLYQGNDSVAVYYIKFKKLWDELTDLFEVTVCASGANCLAIKKAFDIY